MNLGFRQLGLQMSTLDQQAVDAFDERLVECLLELEITQKPVALPNPRLVVPTVDGGGVTGPIVNIAVLLDFQLDGGTSLGSHPRAAGRDG
jgi:hypothetical protein